jgi:hypothetical protein
MIGKWMAMLVSARAGAGSRQGTDAEHRVQTGEDRAPKDALDMRALGVDRDVDEAVREAERGHDPDQAGRPGGERDRGQCGSEGDERAGEQTTASRSTDDGAGAGNAHESADHQAREDDGELVGGEVEPILNRGDARGEGAERGPRDEEAGTDSESLAACRWRAEAEHATQVAATSS